jgi:hypothetical protein
MKLIKPGDKHAFLLGVLASITAVIVWDVIKSKYKLLNYKIDKDIKKI